MYTAIRKIIEAAWENRELLKKEETRSAIDQVIGLLDKGIAHGYSNRRRLASERMGKKSGYLIFSNPTHVDHDHGTIRVSR